MIKLLPLLALLVGCAHSDPWTRADTRWQMAHTLALAADAYTTTQIQYHPTIGEVDPITKKVLGQQPGTAETWQYFASKAIVDYLIAMSLPEEWRRWWQVGGIGMHGYYAVQNCEVGLCGNRPKKIPVCPDCRPVK